MEIKLHKNRIALIDEDDKEIITNRSWYVGKNGYASSRGKTNGKLITMHRLVMGFPKNEIIDHINGNKLDNRKENLRICSKIINSLNSKKPNGFHFWSTRGVYRAQMTVLGKKYILCTSKDISIVQSEYRRAKKIVLENGVDYFCNWFNERYKKKCLNCNENYISKFYKQKACSRKCLRRYNFNLVGYWT